MVHVGCFTIFQLMVKDRGHLNQLSDAVIGSGAVMTWSIFEDTLKD